MMSGELMRAGVGEARERRHVLPGVAAGTSIHRRNGRLPLGHGCQEADECDRQILCQQAERSPLWLDAMLF